MTTKAMAYDHPTYTAVQQISGGNLSGNGGTTQRFAAIATTLLKSITVTYVTAGTVADAKSLLVVSQGTATTTTALHTRTGAVGVVTATRTETLSAGDVAYIVKGADATEVSCATFETVILPGASVTL